jgi:acetyl-CoA carboxylase biotin carboxyl carrier protein
VIGAVIVNTVSERDVETLVDLFSHSEWRELHLTLVDFELFLSKDVGALAPAAARTASPLETKAEFQPSIAPAAEPSAAHPPGLRVPDGWTVVKATNLGTFYRAPKPGAASFVEIDAIVSKTSELCLIEVMKLFTTLRAGTNGRVREIYANDGDLVEYDQPLFLIEPDV